MVGLHMVQKMANFKEALEFGEEGEKEVALFLMNKGYTVSVSYTHLTLPTIYSV